MKLGYMDDFKLGGRIQAVASDFERIIDAEKRIGLRLNTTKYEIVANNFNIIKNYLMFKDVKKVIREDLKIVGASILQGPAVDKVLLEKFEDLERAIQRLTLLQSHDALCLLRYALALPKFLYVLRTAPCAGNNLIARFENTLQGLSSILNVQLSDDQWTQAFSFRWAVWELEAR